MSKKNNYNQKEKKELLKELKENQKKLLEAQMDLISRKTKDTSLPARIRKDVARIKTSMKIKEIGG